MILFHATMKLDIQAKFILRISENRFHGEDELTLRVCVASSINGCLTAAP